MRYAMYGLYAEWAMAFLWGANCGMRRAVSCFVFADCTYCCARVPSRVASFVLSLLPSMLRSARLWRCGVMWGLGLRLSLYNLTNKDEILTETTGFSLYLALVSQRQRVFCQESVAAVASPDRSHSPFECQTHLEVPPLSQQRRMSQAQARK